MYGENRILTGAFSTVKAAAVKGFDLSRAYPNPFRGTMRVAFEVPAVTGGAAQALEIGIFDLKGNLVRQLAKGAYRPGHYDVSWNAGEVRDGARAANVYVVRMKAQNFDKRLKVIRLR